MKTKFNRILTLLLVFTVHFAFAQQSISGIVSDDTGPLPGVSVLIKGTSTGVETDFDGNYTIQANKGNILQFSYIGMEIVFKTVENNSIINVVMEPSSENVLDEVVVVAYGTKTKDEMTSAVAVMGEEQLAKLSPSTTVDNMLQGVASGVQVVAANGKPGQTAFVRVRGVGSINATSAPLYVIDGVIAPDMSSINPNEIESMSVLKDAATASLYGSRAANGVIVIKTKSGRKNQDATVAISSRLGFGQHIKDNYRMMNTAEKMQYENELSMLGVPNAMSLPGANIGSQDQYDYYLGLNHNWEDTLLRQATILSNSLSVTGGSEDFSYFFSLGHDKNTGIIKTIDGFERLSGRLNVGYDAKDWLELSANISISNYSTDEPRDRNNVQNPFRAMYDYNPYEPLYIVDADGNTIYDENGEAGYNLTSSGFSISEALVHNPESEYRTAVMGGLTAKIKISDNLSNTFKVGATNTSYRREYFVEPGSVLDGYVGDANNPGIKTDNGSNDIDLTLTNLLTFDKTFAEIHKLSLTGLFEFNKDTYRTYRLSSIGFSSPDLSVQSIAAQPTVVSSSLIDAAMLSAGVFLDYNFDGKYVATASIRRDGSSTFGENARYGTFWSASAAWNIHNENFMDDNFINELKLRASIGTSGNKGNRRDAGIYYAHLAQIGFDSFNGNSIAYPIDNGNPDLSWEINSIWNVGLEFNAFNRRVKGVVDYYQRTSSDLLLDMELPTLGGELDGSIYANIGEMLNKGIELELSGDIIKNENMNLRIGGNISFINNEVTKLVPTSEDPEGAPIVRNNGITILEVGEEINTFYLPRWAGVDSATGQPMWYLNEDGDETTFDSSEAFLKTLNGKSPIADFDGGFNLYAAYKGFDFGADVYFKVGHYIMNYMESNMLSDGTGIDANQRIDAFNYWRNPGDTDVLPSPLYGNEAQQNSDRWLQKGDYIRLRNLTLGYNLPREFAEQISFKSLRIYLQGQNFFTYAPHFNGDPEVGIGSGETSNDVFGTYTLYSYPQTQSLSLGIDLKF